MHLSKRVAVTIIYNCIYTAEYVIRIPILVVQFWIFTVSHIEKSDASKNRLQIKI